MLAVRAEKSKILILLSMMIAIASSFQPSIISSSSLSTTPSLRYSQTKKDPLQGRIYQQSKDDDDDDEPFVFDPLLSPHAYASGTDAGPSAKQTSSLTNQDETVTEEESDDWTPFQMKSVKDDFKGASEKEYGVEKSVFTRKWSASMNDILNEEQMMDNGKNDINDNLSSRSEKKNDNVDDTFDPLLSPHLYPKGTSAGPIQKQKFSKSQKPQRIGILLIDHGSRREASNLHLENMAFLFQQKAPSNYVIKAAHMEIAKPSILDGIQTLINGDDDNDDGVDVVVCHPYFLSPGRHVIEDVPELIDEAQKDMKIGKYYDPNDENVAKNNVPVVCTGHVGSMMDRMIDMIGEMVNETIEREGLGGYEEESTPAESSSIGGFFGQVQRMIDEQL